ncbi:ZCHC3 protein, partial [Atractosteus spatula]|nr:ZCHC3 protein [Atractosteus spatula]
MFLSRFVDIQGAVWTGKRRYMVRLRPKLSGEEGVLHPPAYFSIGSNGGYLFYPGQPLTCKKCLQLGHIAANCPGGVCRRCGAAGHEAKTCGQIMTCDLCGSMDHVYRTCPRKRKSFADIVKGPSEAPKRDAPGPSEGPVMFSGTKVPSEKGDKGEPEQEGEGSGGTVTDQPVSRSWADVAPEGGLESPSWSPVLSRSAKRKGGRGSKSPTWRRAKFSMQNHFQGLPVETLDSDLEGAEEGGSKEVVATDDPLVLAGE